MNDHPTPHGSYAANGRHARMVIWNDLQTKAAVELGRIDALLRANPQIGILVRDGAPVYYVNAPEYAEATGPAALLSPTEAASRGGAVDWELLSDGLPGDGELVMVYTPDTGDGERVGFDGIEDGAWVEHSQQREHFVMAGGAGAAGPDCVCTGPAEAAPYTHWARFNRPGEVRSAGSRGGAVVDEVAKLVSGMEADSSDYHRHSRDWMSACEHYAKRFRAALNAGQSGAAGDDRSAAAVRLALAEGWTWNGEAWVRPPVTNGLHVTVLHTEGDEPFICGVQGKVTVHGLEEIEAEIRSEGDDHFDRGEGEYVFSASYFSGERDEMGRVELPAGWEVRVESFAALAPFTAAQQESSHG